MWTRIAAVTAALLAFPLGAGWDEYKPSTLQAALASARWDAPCDWCFTPGLPYLIRVTFEGRTRPTPPRRQQFIEKWLKSIGSPAPASIFGNEIAVREADREYWLPIQSVLIPPLSREVPPGSEVSLYVVLAGATDWQKANADVVLLVNEFRK